MRYASLVLCGYILSNPESFVNGFVKKDDYFFAAAMRGEWKSYLEIAMFGMKHEIRCIAQKFREKVYDLSIVNGNIFVL